MASVKSSVKTDAGYTWELRLDYTVTTDEKELQSTVVCTLYLYHGSEGGYNLGTDSAYYMICGHKVYKTYDFRGVAPKWTKLGSRTITVDHADDGTGSVDLSASWVSDNKTEWTPAKISLKKTVALPTIRRNLLWKNDAGTWRRGWLWRKVFGVWKKIAVHENKDGIWKEGV